MGKNKEMLELEIEIDDFVQDVVLSYNPKMMMYLLKQLIDGTADEIKQARQAGQVQILKELLEEWNTKVEEVKDALHESYPTIDYHPHYEAIFEDLINQKIQEIEK